MHLKFPAPLVATASFLALSACMGTDSGVGDYQTLASTSQTGSSDIGGNNVSKATGVIAVGRVTGSWNRATGVITIDDGATVITDPSGNYTTTGTITDGSSTLNGNTSFGTYDYVTYYSGSYNNGGTTYSATGQAGVVTATADVPTSGTANYSGDAVVSYGVADGATIRTGALYGNSSAAVNFGAGTVNASLTGLTPTSGNPDLDQVELSNMSISGNQFGGGSMTTSLSGAPVDLVGANASTGIAGNFYGYDTSNHIPDQIGATAMKEGDSGAIIATFIGD